VITPPTRLNHSTQLNWRRALWSLSWPVESSRAGRCDGGAENAGHEIAIHESAAKMQRWKTRDMKNARNTEYGKPKVQKRSDYEDAIR